MKRKALTTAVLAGVAGVAGIANISGAVNLNNDGLGEALIYPYYTVNNGNDTLISIVNTTDQVKAVKVRFLEAENSQEVLDFNLYLSPFDVWTGAITSLSADGPGVIATGDVSCTVPSLFDQRSGTLPNGLPFVNFRTTLFNDGGSTGVSRTREGYLELIEMGEVAYGASGLIGNNAIHGAGGVPNCSAIVAAWLPGGTFALDPSANGQVTAPGGGLFGTGTIINVADGYAGAYPAEAIDGFFDPIDLNDNLHAAPGSVRPDLTQAQTGGPADPVISNVFFNGTVVTSSWDISRRVDAVSAIFMRDAVLNEYAIDAAVNGATEWVITFPTKRYYVQNTGSGNNAIPPFTNEFASNGTGACEEVGIRFWNREELTTVGGIDFSPSVTPGGPQLCWEAQVISFGESGAPSDIFGSPLSANIAVDSVGFENGWARIDLDADGQSYTSADGDVYNGLPATGFAFQVVQNGTLTDAAGNNVLANYAGLFAHRYSRDIIGS